MNIQYRNVYNCMIKPLTSIYSSFLETVYPFCGDKNAEVTGKYCIEVDFE